MGDLQDIAIVGIGCRFPGADNLEEFWRVLTKGENHVKEVPASRWNLDVFFDPDPNTPGKTYVRNAGFVKGVEEWDHRFFGLNDIEAELVDPQQRLVLECVHMALEDGGIRRNDIDGSDTAVYIGSMTDDYKGHVMDDVGLSSAYSVTGTHNSIISARVSYNYNLLGPSLTLDTACSSSLVAIDLASQAIHTGICTLAICGGVNVLLDPQMFIALAKARMLSPSGQCKTFTKEADGYARGEGCGIVILKKLKQAIKDGNKIWSIIKTGVNQDGHMTTPITAPSGLQQERLIKRTYARYNIDTSCIQVIEAHGTGTLIGDPTEINALGAHFGKKANSQSPVYVGSVKTNIGHLEAAAGVAGLIKVLLMIKYHTIVPSLWYKKDNENPKLKMSDHGFIVPTECTNWCKSESEKRLACVNSFGFGGTNAHAIIEEYQESKPGISSAVGTINTFPYIITFSAIDRYSLKENMQSTRNALESNSYDLSSLSCTSTCKRDHFKERKAVFGKTHEEIMSALKKSLEADDEPVKVTMTKRIVFVFCGVGTSWKGMCNSLMKIKAFRSAVKQIDQVLQPLSGWAVAELFQNSLDFQADPMKAHIAIFACQVGLTMLWKHIGITPDAIVGQSVGEVAAAFAANYFDLETAVNIIYNRSKVLASVNQGGMIVVSNVDVEIIEKLCQTVGSVIAVYNSPVSCTVSGSIDQVDRLKYQLSKPEYSNAKIIRLDVKCAYHSHFVEQAALHLREQLEGMSCAGGNIAVFSTVTGQQESSYTIGKSSYWEKNVKMPVLFSQAIKKASSDQSHDIFVEIGPSPVLRAHLDSILHSRTNYSIVLSMRKHSELDTITASICQLYQLGLEPKWKNINPCQLQCTDIPRNNLQKRRMFYQSQEAVMRINGFEIQKDDHLFIKRFPKNNGTASFRAEINEETTSFVFQHFVKREIVIPGATYADIGFEIGRTVEGLSKQDTIVSLEFLRPVKVKTKEKTSLDISTIKQRDELLFHVKHADVTICKGWVHKTKLDEMSETIVDVDLIRTTISSAECRRMGENEMYGYLMSLGFQYGICFKLLKSCVTNGVECLTEVELPDVLMSDLQLTTIHPCILDAMVQSTINVTTEELFDKIKAEKLSFLPVAMGKIHVRKRPERNMYLYTKRTNTTLLDSVFQLHYNILLMNNDGFVIAEVQNYTTYGKRNGLTAPCELKYDLTWHDFHLPLEKARQRANILILSTAEISEMKNHLDDIGHTFIAKATRNMSGDDVGKIFKVAKSHWKSVSNTDAVLLVIDKFETSSITHECAEYIHSVVRENCLFLSTVVKYMVSKGMSIPIYIATQNTQLSLSNLYENLSLVGEELWGFVRSVNIEFIHGVITLIDLQPSLSETISTLLKFVSSSCRNPDTVNTEIIIFKNKTYGAQFTKVPRKNVLPKLRNEVALLEKSMLPHKILTDRSIKVGTLYVCESSGEAYRRKNDNLLLKLNRVCVHPVCIYPRTSSGIDLDQDIWKDTIKDGHELLGIEYTGYKLYRNKKGKTSCTEPKVDDEIKNDFSNRWEIACIYPSKLLTEMNIPEDCSVLLKDLKVYIPGLLLYTVISFRLCEFVPRGSKVVIPNNDEPTSGNFLLTCILQTCKSCKVISENMNVGNSAGIDYLVSIDQIDESCVAVGKCKSIICIDGCIKGSLRMKISRSKDQRLTCLSVAHLLERKHISKCLPKAVDWIQQNVHKVSKMQYIRSMHNDQKCCIPCPTTDIVSNGRLLLPIRKPLQSLFNKSSVYIVTGGMTGLGWELAVLLAEMGAGTIATFSRRNIPEEKLTQIEGIMKKTGCKIFGIQADVTKLESVENAISEAERLSQGNKIQGVFHCAGVLEGKLLTQLEKSQLDYVLRPKVIGTLNMHIATMKHKLHYFVVSSSINSLIGSPGQASYGAANCFLDTFIDWRRSQGLTGQSINWGALAIGMAARPEFTDNFEKRGFNLLSVSDIRSCFQDALMGNVTKTIYTDVNWNMHAKDYDNPYMKRFRIRMSVFLEQEITELRPQSSDANHLYIDQQKLQNSSKAAQIEAITQVILKITGKVIWQDFHQLDSSTAIADLSLDSMSSVTFINIVQDVTGYRISPTFLLNTNNTLKDVVLLLQEKMFNGKHTNDLKKTTESNTYL